MREYLFSAKLFLATVYPAKTAYRIITVQITLVSCKYTLYTCKNLVFCKKILYLFLCGSQEAITFLQRNENWKQNGKTVDKSLRNEVKFTC
jgi:hypothetical protein